MLKNDFRGGTSQYVQSKLTWCKNKTKHMWKVKNDILIYFTVLSNTYHMQRNF